MSSDSQAGERREGRMTDGCFLLFVYSELEDLAQARVSQIHPLLSY